MCPIKPFCIGSRSGPGTGNKNDPAGADSPALARKKSWIQESVPASAILNHSITVTRRQGSHCTLLFFVLYNIPFYDSVQFTSVAQSCPTLCDPMNRSMPGLPVHHQLPEFTQTHIYRVSDAIQPSHPLSSHSPPAPNPSQHQSLFQ